MRRKFYSWLYNTQGSGDQLKVACVTISIDRDPEKNMGKIINHVDSLMQAHPDAKLVLFGEMLLGWYDPENSPEYHQAIARPLSKDHLQPLIDRCK